VPAATLVRIRSGAQAVSAVEVFFDLVYAFSVTQLSHYLLVHPSLEGALQTAILLGLVWIVWSSTIYVVNWLDPDRFPVRLLFLGIMLLSLPMSSALPDAFLSGGFAVALAFAAIQVGRTLFAVLALRRTPSERNFQRLLVWNVFTSALAILGSFGEGHLREVLWALVIAVDLFSTALGYYVPGLGRSSTHDWTVDGGHTAERNQAFIMIALGESIVIIGASLGTFAALTVGTMAAYLLAFGSTVALWLIYFDRSARYAARAIATSSDPGRLARSAFYWIHPVMIAGIIVVAAGDRRVLEHPLANAGLATASMLLGGSALFLAGHALFKVAVFRHVPWSRIVAALLLTLLIPVATTLPALVVSGVAVAFVLLVVVADRVQLSRHPELALEA
jgi:low temperature requirement protein LtrA